MGVLLLHPLPAPRDWRWRGIDHEEARSAECRAGTEAERLGFDTLWFSDLTTAPATDPLLSAALAAAWTSRIKLGITIVPFGYQPFVFARQLAQVDRLSRLSQLGRLSQLLHVDHQRRELGNHRHQLPGADGL